jgi:signal transduction histidine kinase
MLKEIETALAKLLEVKIYIEQSLDDKAILKLNSSLEFIQARLEGLKTLAAEYGKSTKDFYASDAGIKPATYELHDLKKAKKEAEKANRAKSEFLAQMSHDLRTPLNGILGYAQILKRDENLTTLQRAGIYVIERSSNHLLSMINDLLDLSKIEAEKMELHESPSNIPKFLTNISEMIRIQAQKKGVSFRYETTSDLPQAVKIDEKQLSQVLLNLLSNAVKFTERGGVALKVGLIDHKSLVCFRVSDSGIGIPSDKLDVI